MDTKTLQVELNKHNPALKLDDDGVAGRRTLAAVDALLGSTTNTGWMDWQDDRRLVAAEQIILHDVYRIEVGEVDGIVGEQMRYARSVYEGRKANGGKPNPTIEQWRDALPKTPIPATPSRTKWPHQSQVQNFYGPPGSGQTKLTLPYPMRVAWDLKTVVRSWSCHTKCREAFEKIFKNTLDHYGIEEIKRLRLDVWGGTLNVRKMRGGSSWSMHAFGIAVDIDPERNQLKWGRDKATLDNPPYEKYWSFVEAEGGLSLGRARNFDWMHFQFTRDLA